MASPGDMNPPPYEVERRFLVPDLAFLAGHQASQIEQRYLAITPAAEIRLRRVGDGDVILTVKSGPGLRRSEQEIAIADVTAGEDLMDHSDLAIHKRRYSLVVDGTARLAGKASLFTVDVFSGANSGLAIAEVELGEPIEDITIPPWCGIEITGIENFYNSRLAVRPIERWPTEVKKKYGL